MIESETVRAVIDQDLAENDRLDENQLLTVRKYIVEHRAEEFICSETNNGLINLCDMYNALFKSMMNSPGLGEYRTVACDTLSVWIQRTSQCLRIEAMDTSYVDAFIFSIKRLINISDFDAIFDFVCEYWTDSGAALGNALRELFTKTMSLLERIMPIEDKLAKLNVWIERILKYPRTMRVVYFTLEIFAQQVGGQRLIDKDGTLIETSLKLTYSNALANPICKMITMILSTTRSHYESDVAWLESWRNDVATALADSRLRRHLEIYLLPNIFKLSKTAYQEFISNMQNSNDLDVSVLIGCLKVGQDLAYDSDIPLPSDFLSELLHSGSQERRIGGLSLAVSCPQASRPIHSEILDVVLEALDDLILDSDPEFRNKVYGFMRQAVARIRDSSYAKARELRKLKQKNIQHERTVELEKFLNKNKFFLDSYFSYIKDLLRPGSSYQRMHMSLRLLMSLVKSGLDDRVSNTWYEKNSLEFPFHLDLFDKETVNLLFDNLLNKYEDIRKTAGDILKMAPEAAFFGSSEENSIIEFIDYKAQEGFELVRGIRFREGDGGARVLDVCYYLTRRFVSRDAANSFLDRLVDILDNAVKIAEDNLISAVAKHPVHGYFTALRLVFEQLELEAYDQERTVTIVSRILSICKRMWKSVIGILSHNSPEGNMPDEIDGLDDMFGPASQVVLSYSWRAISESTAVFTILLDRNLPVDTMEVGELVMDELATIRHRGAFSSVYPTFVACCKRCRRSNDERLNALPEEWLDRNMKLIETKAQVITRRSGGLPYLVVGIIAADIESGRIEGPALLESIFERLEKIARIPVREVERTDLPQVHALNCIKILFVETRLANVATHFVDRGASLAIEAFSSAEWSIRNCGVMLFAALQTRLFGSASREQKKETKMSAKLFFMRFKGLRSVLGYYARLEVDKRNVEGIFPLLSLLARVEATNDYDGLDEFKPFLLRCLENPLWKVREMAARAILAITVPIQEFVDDISSERVNQNGIHGRLLAIQYGRMERDAILCGLATVSPSKLCNINKRAWLQIGISAGSDISLKALTDFDSVASWWRAGGRLLTSELVKARVTRAVLDLPQSDAIKSIKNCLADNYALEFTLDVLDESEIATPELGSDVWRIVADTGIWDSIREIAVRVYNRMWADNVEESAIRWQLLYDCIEEKRKEANSLGEAALSALGRATATVKDDMTKERENLWLNLIKVHQADEESYLSRRAALQSTVGYVRSISDWSCSLMFTRVAFVLYDFLQDDDDTLRELAGQCVCSNILHSELSTAVTTSKRLVQSIVDQGDVEEIRSSSIKRLIDINGPQPEIQLAIAKEQDTSLFVVESANLYRNDISDVQVWGGVLAKVGLKDKLQKRQLKEWHNMAEQLISTLNDIMCRRNADIRAILEKINLLKALTE
ncbi:putative death-receptor fusion protein-domain-containing protein [Dipodascopsis uninucleata]